jgi:hypothetical protein
METKKQIILKLREEFNRWEELIAGLNEGQINLPLTPSTFSIKDTLAHLMAWQQVSIGRLTAARLGKEPVFPEWAVGIDPDTEEADPINARIYELYRQQSWARVHQDWREGFIRFLKLSEDIPENDFADAKKYAWLNGYPLLAVLEGSFEHHHNDHLEPLLAWLREHGKTKSG